MAGIFTGASFSSYDDFMSTLQRYNETEHMSFVKLISVKLPEDDEVARKLIYRQVIYKCKQGTKRSSERSLNVDCPARIKLTKKCHPDGHKLVVSLCNLKHTCQPTDSMARKAPTNKAKPTVVNRRSMPSISKKMTEKPSGMVSVGKGGHRQRYSTPGATQHHTPDRNKKRTSPKSILNKNGDKSQVRKAPTNKAKFTVVNRRSMASTSEKNTTEKLPGMVSVGKSGHRQRYSTPAATQYHTPERNKIRNRGTPKSILKKDGDKSQAAEKTGPSVGGHHVTFKSKATEQASRRAQLNSWLESKGKTPSKCRHLMCFDADMSAKKKRAKLVDRTLSLNLLDEQNKILEKEEVIKEVHHQPAEVSGQENKPATTPTITTTPTMATTPTVITTPTLVPMSPLPDVSSPFTHPPSEGESSDKAICQHIKVMLEECLILFEAGCPRDHILQWLDEMDANIARTATFAPFYICKARVLADDSERMLEVLCQAVRNNAQPSHVLATEIWNMLHPIVSLARPPPPDRQCSPVRSPPIPVPAATSSPPIPEPAATSSPPIPEPAATSSLPIPVSSATSAVNSPPNPVPLVQKPEKGRVLRFSITSTTPLSSRPMTETTPLAVVTPVKRSTRLSGRRSATPGRLTREINSLSDLSQPEKEAMLFQENIAITGE